MLKRSKFSRKRSAYEEDINPMNYMSNLSDAMLVLAVGMMLALVAAWNVDITMMQSEAGKKNEQNAVELSEEVDSLHTSSEKEEDSVSVEDFGLTEFGKVYVDAEGNYYVIEEAGDRE